MNIVDLDIVNFNICQETGCSLTITGNSAYSDTFNLGQNIYPFEDCVTINVLVHKKTNSEEYIFSEVSHKCSEVEPPNPEVELPISDIDTINIQEDGHYIIYHIIIPTKDPSEYINQSTELTTNYYWYADERIYYKGPNGESDNYELKKILGLLSNTNSSIRYACKDIFVLCHLQECFVNHCKDIFSNLYTFQCSKKSSKVDTFNRDLLWMTINVIKYYIENGQYSTAQALLEEFENCGSTICKQSSSTKLNSNGCGCSR